MLNFLDEIKKRVLIYDGSKGYMLQKFGMKGGECSELWNVEHRDIVKKIYSLYKEAGADVIQTNTFLGNRINLQKYGLGDRVYELNYEGARLAREVMGQDGFVAASIGPTGKLLEPLGDMDFETAYEIFAEQIKALVDGGVDLINFETFTDLAEMQAALLAARENTDIPIICSISYEKNNKTLMGCDPRTATVILKSKGADMIGTNCSFGPDNMIKVVKEIYEAGSGYLMVKPNAGLPDVKDGTIVYNESPERFADVVVKFVRYGARLIGGCCGTTPEYIKAIEKKVSLIEIPDDSVFPAYNENIITSSVSSFDISSSFNINVGQEDGVITCFKGADVGKISLFEDREVCSKLKNGNLELIDDMAMDLAEKEHDLIYINVDSGIEGKDFSLLSKVVNKAQAYLKQPFIIETVYPEALEKALRTYKGRAGVIIRGNDENKLNRIAEKYGALVIRK